MSSENKKIRISDYYILYLDILGYKNHMVQANNNLEAQNEFLDQIKTIVDDCYRKESEQQNGKSYIKVKVFSDNILFAIKIVQDMRQYLIIFKRSLRGILTPKYTFLILKKGM